MQAMASTRTMEPLYQSIGQQMWSPMWGPPSNPG